MTPLLGIVFLFIIAYIGAFFYQKYHLESGWLKVLFFSGSLNLILGYMIGPNILGILTDEVIGKLYVLVGLVLGWAGFLIGMQAKKSELKRFQRSYFLYSIINFLLMFIMMLVLVSALNQTLKLSINFSVQILAAVLGAVSSPILIAILKEQLNLRGPFIHLLQFSVALDNVLGVIIFGLAVAFISQPHYEYFHFF